MRVLGVETSCDETGISVYDDEIGIVTNKLYSQVKLHANYGGVVPELSARDHARNIFPLVQSALKEANMHTRDINGVAYTAGPGIVGSLLVGMTIGCALAFSLGVPAIPVHHMEGHLLATMLEENSPPFPFVALFISGGHTQLISVAGIGKYLILGDFLDDAAGEAFDKTSHLLGFHYPGGSMLSKIAQKGKEGRWIFPRPMIDRSGLDFSFSGLKNFAENIIRSNKDEQNFSDIARAFEDSVVDMLVIKCKRALEYTGFKRLVISGGVSANCKIRDQLDHMSKKNILDIFYSRYEFCSDNGAMIAYAGRMRLQSIKKQELNLSVLPRLQ